MSKGQLSRLKEAVLVVVHAKRAKKRGRGPSMSFGEIRNPRIALHMALTVFKEATKEAMDYLEGFKTTTIHRFVDYPGNIVRSLEKAGLTLTDIGSSEEELVRLEREAHKREAMDYLEGFKTTTIHRLVDYPGSIVRSLEKAGLTLTDIGSSEEELDKLEREACGRENNPITFDGIVGRMVKRLKKMERRNPTAR